MEKRSLGCGMEASPCGSELIHFENNPCQRKFPYRPPHSPKAAPRVRLRIRPVSLPYRPGRPPMFKASANIVLATSITGSLPRPSWYDAVLGSQSFLEAMMNARYREQYEDAVSVHLRAQEQAGIDICTDGDAHFDDEVAGMSWQSYAPRHMSGFAPMGEMTAYNVAQASHPRGHILHDFLEARVLPLAIRCDVEGGATADATPGQVRHHPAGTDRRIRRGRALQESGRAKLGALGRAARGAARDRRCRLPGAAARGAADPHGAGAWQGLRQARHARPYSALQQHRERLVRQDGSLVPHLLGQPGTAAHLQGGTELSADARRARHA